MRNSAVCLLLVAPLLAQSGRPIPQQAPIDALVQGYRSAFNNGKYDEAACQRDEARRLLAEIPVNDPQFVNWVRRVSQLYSAGGFGVQGREVLEQALIKAGALKDSSPVRVALLEALGGAWEDDRNLLKAAAYLEQALSAAEAQPPRTDTALEDASLYLRLFRLYNDLGRPQDAEQLHSRIAVHLKNPDGLQARLHLPQSQFEAAAGAQRAIGAQSGVAWETYQRLPELLQPSGSHVAAPANSDPPRTLETDDQVYRRLVDSASKALSTTVIPLLDAQRGYAGVLLRQGRWREFEQVAELYRDTLIASRGAQTGWMENYLRLRIQAGRFAERRQTALLDAQDLVKLEESLSGSTSEPFMRATQTLAIALEAAENASAALPLRSRVVALADLVYPVNDSRRLTARADTARAFAARQLFDEAERLVREAVAIAQANHLPDRAFQDALEQVLQMKQARKSNPTSLK